MTTRSACLPVACMVLLSAFALSPAAAAVQTVLGRSFLVGDPAPGVDASLRRVQVLANEPFSDDALVGDPVANGAIVEVVANGAISSVQTFMLPAGVLSSTAPGWKALGSPVSGYIYKDAHGVNGAVQLFSLRRTGSGTVSITLRVKGSLGPGPQPHVTVVPPAPGTDGGIRVSINGGDTYCVAFGGPAGGAVTNSPTGIGTKSFRIARTSVTPTVEIGCPTSAVTTTTISAPTTTTTSSTSTVTTSSTTTTSTSTSSSTSTTHSTSSTVSTSTTTTSRSTTSSTSTSTSTSTSSSSSASSTSSSSTSSSTSASSSTSTSSSSSSSRTSTSSTSSTTTTTIPCPSRLTFRSTAGTTSCGIPGGNPAAPFAGAIYSDAAGTVQLGTLGLGCEYTGGDGALEFAPASLPTGSSSIFDVPACAGNLVQLAGGAGTGAVAANGNSWSGPDVGTDCTIGVSNVRHCTRTGATCTSDADCGGGPGLCNPDPRCAFGAPVPLPAGAFSMCNVSFVRADGGGSVDAATGDAALVLPSTTYLYLTGNSDKLCFDGSPGTDGLGRCTSDANCGGTAGACRFEQPCPICAATSTGNRCVGGRSHGQTCTAAAAGGTSIDCLPRGLDFVVSRDDDPSPLQTGQTVLTAVQNPFRSNGWFFCPVGAADTCGYTPARGSTCQRSPGCFGRATCKRIVVHGAAAGPLGDTLAHPVQLASVFCAPASGLALMDGGTGYDLPGPAAVSLRGTLQLVP